MIDWNSPQWGGGVTQAANGSWVPDKHVASTAGPGTDTDAS